jgi:hypothetical protein
MSRKSFALQISALAYGSAGVVGKGYDGMDVFTALFGSEF